MLANTAGDVRPVTAEMAGDPRPATATPFIPIETPTIFGGCLGS